MLWKGPEDKARKGCGEKGRGRLAERRWKKEEMGKKRRPREKQKERRGRKRKAWEMRLPSGFQRGSTRVMDSSRHQALCEEREVGWAGALHPSSPTACSSHMTRQPLPSGCLGRESSGQLDAAEVRDLDTDGSGALGGPQGSWGPVGVIELPHMCEGKGDPGAMSSGDSRNHPWCIF